jgi:hypothetical protein
VPHRRTDVRPPQCSVILPSTSSLLLNWRCRLSQPNVRSTIQRLGRITTPRLPRGQLTTSTCSHSYSSPDHRLCLPLVSPDVAQTWKAPRNFAPTSSAPSVVETMQHAPRPPEAYPACQPRCAAAPHHGYSTTEAASERGFGDSGRLAVDVRGNPVGIMSRCLAVVAAQGAVEVFSTCPHHLTRGRRRRQRPFAKSAARSSTG